jgi:anti-anti-sigma regulatory factor
VSARKARGARRSARLKLGASLTIYQAAEAKARLLKALELGAELEIDLASVKEIDTAGVQLLVMAKREARRRGLDVRLVAHGKATLEALDDYQLGGFFGDPVILSSREAAASAPEAP